MCGAPFSLGECRTIFSLIIDACARDWAYKVPTTLPIFLISGALDPVGLFGVGVEATYSNLQTAGHNPFIMLYPDARHEILNEGLEIRNQVYYNVLQWIMMVLNKNNGLDMSSGVENIDEIIKEMAELSKPITE